MTAVMAGILTVALLALATIVAFIVSVVAARMNSPRLELYTLTAVGFSILFAVVGVFTAYALALDGVL